MRRGVATDRSPLLTTAKGHPLTTTRPFHTALGRRRRRQSDLLSEAPKAVSVMSSYDGQRADGDARQHNGNICQSTPNVNYGRSGYS